jgi:Bacteriophage HK97-gp10, putative tail-component
MPIDVAATMAGLDALAHRVSHATERIVERSAHVFQALAMANAPVGDPENSTNAPGDLARSIQVDGPYGGGDSFVARVGPTVTTANPGPYGRIMNYGRQREFGGEITPNGPKMLVFEKFGSVYFASRVYQDGAFYLTRARVEGGPTVEVVIVEELTVAVEG